MPYTKKQKRFFRVVAHNPDIAKQHGMTMKQARRLMNESKRMPGKAR